MKVLNKLIRCVCPRCEKGFHKEINNTGKCSCGRTLKIIG